MFLKLINRGAVETSIYIRICIECDMNIGVSEPILQNDRFHASLDTPRREGVSE